MKAAKITILLIVIIVLINWCRVNNFDSPLPHCLPLLGGKNPSFYDIGGIICIGIGILGLSRLSRNKHESDE
jgi:hypothetical protein